MIADEKRAAYMRRRDFLGTTAMMALLGPSCLHHLIYTGSRPITMAIPSAEHFAPGEIITIENSGGGLLTIQLPQDALNVRLGSGEKWEGRFSGGTWVTVT